MQALIGLGQSTELVTGDKTLSDTALCIEDKVCQGRGEHRKPAITLARCLIAPYTLTQSGKYF